MTKAWVNEPFNWTGGYAYTLRLDPGEPGMDLADLAEEAEARTSGDRFTQQILKPQGVLDHRLQVAASRATLQDDGTVLLDCYVGLEGFCYRDQGLDGGWGRGLGEMPDYELNARRAAEGLQHLLRFEGRRSLSVELVQASDAPGRPGWVSEYLATEGRA